jgi:hypothetical protein
MSIQFSNLLPFKVSEVLSVCERLSDLQKRRIVKTMVNIKLLSLETDVYCDSGAAMYIWATDLFYVFAFYDVDQIMYLVDEFETDVVNFGRAFWNSVLTILAATTKKKEDVEVVAPSLPVSMFGIADRRYVTMTGRADMLDMSNMSKVSGLTRQFLETVQYNLATLFAMRYNALRLMK